MALNFSRPFILRPVGTSLLTIALIVCGLLAYGRLPVADLPPTDFPVFVIEMQQAGGSPEEVAASVTTPLERHLGQIADVTDINSTSAQDSSQLIVQFDSTRDVNGADRDVAAALQAARADLPPTIRQNPQYFHFNPASQPIMLLTLTSPTRTLPALYELATTILQQHLSQVRGVGRVEAVGSALPAVRVELNPLPLFRYGIGFEDVRAALASANANAPKGTIDAGPVRYQLDSNDQVERAADYQGLVIGYRNGAPVRLSDVARVEDGVEDSRQSGYINGKQAIIAIIRPQTNANVIGVIHDIKELLPALEAALPPDVTVDLAMDRSITIKASLADTQVTLVVASVLVILVVLVFLRTFRSTLIPTIVVPTSIIGTFAVMHGLGFSLDNLSLMALTVATGFVVDDSIVVLENIARHMEVGMERLEASLLGAREVAFTVTSITVSLVAVFLPILLMGGIAGKLFHEFAMTLTITIVISYVLCLTTTPMLCALMLRVRVAPPAGQPSGAPHGARLATRLGEHISKRIDRALDGLLRVYARSLDQALRHTRLVLLTLPLTILATVLLVMVIPKGFLPITDNALVVGTLTGDPSISFRHMQSKLAEVDAAIRADPDTESDVAFSGSGGGGAPNEADFFIQLKDKRFRHDRPEAFISRLRAKLRPMVGAEFSAYGAGDLEAGSQKSKAAYQYQLQADSDAVLDEWMPKLVAALKRRPELSDVSSSVEPGSKSMIVRLDRDTAARLQLTPELITNTLFDGFGQRAVSTIYNPLNQYHVVMEIDPRFASDPSVLGQIWVSTSGGTPNGSTSSNTIRVSSQGGSTTTAAGTGTTSTSGSSSSAQALRNQIANALAGGTSASTGSAVSVAAETMVPLDAATRVEVGLSPLVISHHGGGVSASLAFNLPHGRSLADAQRVIREEMVLIHMPTAIYGAFSGNAAEVAKAAIDELLITLAAIATIYITLGVLYESTVHPLTILSTLPSAGAGAVLGLLLMGQEFNLIAMLGVILLIGIIKKNAILLIDFALDAERELGMSPREAIRSACLLRFRPIIMTSLAAALGALPLVLSRGYGSELRQPLGIAIIGGLLVSQALTLYTTPVVYLYLDRLSTWPARRQARRLRYQARI